VLMPNTARGGGVSRKITSMTDRRRLKDILEQLDIPEGMGVIVRTAGAERSKAEIKRDYEYLLRLWNEIRDLTLRSTAPALIYEEGNLIKRSIRDLYTRDIDEVLVEGEEGYRTAKAFMKMLMPSHARRVQPYRDTQIGLLHRFQVESQIDAIHSPVVQLRSGGYVVINQTEALVAIDVNSGRSTRERNIEETAVRTNLEAAEEIARQLRLRDLAGLIVIDFIDMEEHRNQGAVERRLKEALRSDRARIQVGRISPFGLLEMSRQRLRPSLVETSTQPCPHCGGTGFIRSTESTALYVLRSIEEEGMRRRSAEICVYVPTAVALYILNQKRDSLVQLESRYGLRVLMARDDALIPPAFRLERLRAYSPTEPAVAPAAPLTQAPEIAEEPDEVDEDAEAVHAERQEQEGEEGRARSRRHRRRRRHRGEDAVSTSREAPTPKTGEAAAEPAEFVYDDDRAGDESDGGEDESDAERPRRRRGRRGGRRRGRREGGLEPAFGEARPASDMAEILPTPDTGEPEVLSVEAAGTEAATGRAPAVFEAVQVSEATDDTSAEATIRLQEAHQAERRAPSASEPEQVSEMLPVPPAQPAAEDSVETVTGKPAAPRRGWWQRLIQP
jgi:ribonuclease E